MSAETQPWFPPEILALNERVKAQREQVEQPPERPARDVPNAMDGVGEALARLAAMPRASEAEIAAHDWREYFTPAFAACGLEGRYWPRLVAWNQPKQERTFGRVRGLLKRCGAVVALLGPRGLGKTTIAAEIIKERVSKTYFTAAQEMPVYRKLTQIIARYKLLYADFGGVNGERLQARLESLCDIPLLVLDEVHDCEDLKLKNRMLKDIVDRRYAAKRDTLLIGNQSAEEFQRTTDDSILSRLGEHGGIIECNWPSWRTRRAA